MNIGADDKLVKSFDPELYSELVKTFLAFDKNSNGVIEKNEFSHLVQILGYNDVAQEEIDKVFKGIDLNNDSVISFTEYLILMKKLTPKIKGKKSKSQA